MTRSLVFAAALVLFAGTATAQDLSAARELYASAEYEEALTALARLKADASPTVAAEIDRYRALCLIALGRTAEADKVIESIVVNDPLYEPEVTEAAPRVRGAFSKIRQRVLPSLARSLYLEAKAAFDRKAYEEASAALEKVVKVIDSIEAPGELGDLRVLASGFLELSRAALKPAPAAPAPAVPAPAPAVNAPAPPAGAPAVRNTDLVALKQDFPQLPFALMSSRAGEYRGIIEVEIDIEGNVVNGRIIQPVHALYDPLLLKAAREWKYEPPRVGGKPVASRKRVEVVLRP